MRLSSSPKFYLFLLMACMSVPLASTVYGQQGNEGGNSRHVLIPSPKTVAWGYYDATTPPALRIKSGDSVEVHTLITSNPQRLEGAGVKPDQIEPSLREIVSAVTDKGPGGHILTGPIY